MMSPIVAIFQIPTRWRAFAAGVQRFSRLPSNTLFCSAERSPPSKRYAETAHAMRITGHAHCTRSCRALRTLLTSLRTPVAV